MADFHGCPAFPLPPPTLQDPKVQQIVDGGQRGPLVGSRDPQEGGQLRSGEEVATEGPRQPFSGPPSKGSVRRYGERPIQRSASELQSTGSESVLTPLKPPLQMPGIASSLTQGGLLIRGFLEEWKGNMGQTGLSTPGGLGISSAPSPETAA